MKIQEVKLGLAALFYYQSPEHEKGLSFEDLAEDKKKVFLALAESVLVNLDKMNLVVVEKSTKNQAAVEAILQDKIEATINDFFDKIKVWKKGAIPREELVARVMGVWKNL